MATVVEAASTPEEEAKAELKRRLDESIKHLSTLPSVMEWLELSELGEARDRKLERLADYAVTMKVDPNLQLEQALKEMAAGRPPKDIVRCLTRYHNEKTESGLAKTSATTYVAVVRSYFSNNWVKMPKSGRQMRVAGSAYEGTRLLTQGEVKGMIEAGKKNGPDKLIVAFLAQGGQRMGVLTAMKRDMIKHVDGHGIIDVNPTLLNPHGVNVNKAETRYTFIVGENTMQLLDEVPAKNGWLLNLSERQIGRRVDELATEIGIQKEILTKIEQRFWHEIHPHVFRRYWKNQMREGLRKAKVSDAIIHDLSVVLDYMMGHKVPFGGTYDAGSFQPTKLLELYKQAESELRVL